MFLVQPYYVTIFQQLKIIPYKYGAEDNISSFSLTNSSLHVQQDRALSKIFCPAPISKVFLSPQKNELVELKSHQVGEKRSDMLQHQFFRFHTAWYFQVLSVAPGLQGSGNKTRKPYSAFLMDPDTFALPQVDTEGIIHR